MTIDTSSEALAKLRIVHMHASMDMDDTIILALIDALEAARAAQIEFRDDAIKALIDALETTRAENARLRSVMGHVRQNVVRDFPNNAIKAGLLEKIDRAAP